MALRRSHTWIILRQELRQIQARDPQICVKHLLIEGDVAAAILQEAREMNYDAIVMGTHGRTGVNRLLMGSVAEAVVREAPCPVVTVKTPVSSRPSLEDYGKRPSP